MKTMMFMDTMLPTILVQKFGAGEIGQNELFARLKAYHSIQIAPFAFLCGCLWACNDIQRF